MCPNAQISTSGSDGDVDLRWDHGLLVGQPRARSQMDPETSEYAFNATVDVHQTATGAGPSPGPCPT